MVEGRPHIKGKCTLVLAFDSSVGLRVFAVRTINLTYANL